MAGRRGGREASGMSSDSTLLAQLDEYTALVSPHLDEPVEAACILTRRGGMTQSLAGHFAGGFQSLMAKKVSARKAGGLPEHFIVAVTAPRVHAFAYKVSAR